MLVLLILLVIQYNNQISDVWVLKWLLQTYMQGTSADVLKMAEVPREHSGSSRFPVGRNRCRAYTGTLTLVWYLPMITSSMYCSFLVPNIKFLNINTKFELLVVTLNFWNFLAKKFFNKDLGLKPSSLGLEMQSPRSILKSKVWNSNLAYPILQSFATNHKVFLKSYYKILAATMMLSNYIVMAL